jgi:hypothetical protein
MTTTNVLLLGLTGAVIDNARAHLDLPDPHLFTGTGIDDVRSAFAQARIDHVIMGAGLDPEIRLAIVREIFQSSDTATVHVKDRASGKEALLPFARAVVHGLSTYTG